MSHIATNIVDASRPMYIVHLYNCIYILAIFGKCLKSGSNAYYDNETLNILEYNILFC